MSEEQEGQEGGLILALDVGTTGCKGILVGRDGSTRGEATRAYPTHTDVALSGAVEQDPEDWWTAVVECCAALQAVATTAEQRICAVAVSGQMQSAVAVDAAGGVLHRALLHCDTRAKAEAAELEGHFGVPTLQGLVGNWKGAASVPAKWRWLQPRVPAPAHLLLSAADFICWRACGVATTDLTNASTTGLLDPVARRWAPALLQFLGLDAAVLPALHDVRQPVGWVTGRLQEVLALGGTAAVPLFHCGGDVGTTTVGAGAAGAGALYCYLGTSAWAAVTRLGYVPPAAAVFTLLHPHPARCIQAASMVTAGGNVDWWREVLQASIPEASTGEEAEGVTYAAVERWAAAAPLGAGGLLFLPHLAGERSPFVDAKARGAFVGLSRSTGTGELCRAVFEGVAFAVRSLCEALDWLPDAEAGDAGGLRVVGGCTRSSVLMQILADVVGCPVQVTHSAHVGALGASVIAGVGLRWFADLEVLQLPEVAVFRPRLPNHAQYSRLYAIHQQLYPALRTAFHALADFT